MKLGLGINLPHIDGAGGQDLYVSLIMTEDGQPITEEDGDNLIRENL